MKRILFPVIFFGLLAACKSTNEISETNVQPIVVAPLPSPNSNDRELPTLVIGITVDQMRFDYLTRFAEDYSNGGLKRLMAEGAVMTNAHYDYMPTYTGPGHACIYTGTGPALNGIIANDWYDREKKRMIYCAQDSTVKGVGTSSEEGMRSPSKLLTTTMCDQMKLHTNQRSKTIGVAMKDRGGILPAGRSADASYWYIGGNEGNWVSSNWYFDQLPQWVNDFNKRGRSEQLLREGWNLLKDVSAYDESLPDNNAYETPFSGMIRPVFPYVFTNDSIRTKNKNYELLKGIPMGMTLTTEFAIAAIEGEQLGKDEHTDFLCLSYSGTDYVGHRFGVQSKETQDCYLRFDLEIENLLNWLDVNMKGKYLIFLSADHGGAEVPSHVQTVQLAGDYWIPGNMIDDVKALLNTKFGVGEYVLNYSNDQFFLDRKLIESRKLNLEDVQDAIVTKTLEYPGVYTALAAHDLMSKEYTEGVRNRIMNGFHPKRSGDVVVVTMPGWIEYGRTGTTHGSPFPYDTHVPIIFFGNGVEKGHYVQAANVSDIAPTICSYLGIMEPNGTSGKDLGVLKK
jgi:predicted AlkP superfamily pyrophosphatase or phosphodiesterase